MFRKSISAALATATVGLGFMLATPATANAHDIRGHVGYSHGHGRGHVELHFGHKPRVHKRKIRRHGLCHPGRAVHKAERRGLRKVRVKRVNDRYVVIKGRKHGSKVRVAFHRGSPRCKVAWVDHRPRRGYRY